MLVLSRKANESVTIGEDVEVTVLRFDRKRVVLGIVAPKATKVLRKELPKRIAESPAARRAKRP